MSGFARLQAEDRRLTILRTLAEDAGRRANEFILKRVLKAIGHDVSRDVLRAELAWLLEHRLIRIERLHDEAGAEFQIAVLTEDGEDVAGGRPHTGVARPVAR
ncbi:hypothetical protein ACQW02_19870 [Humitalea sp. 24SJ18S-53]|uniref:VpaChn25_0724 family phage protein n=1 Tax=Humitalea sp. 24SJ18S-53 TaxID=3422307 RepID=UPI003D673A3C